MTKKITLMIAEVIALMVVLQLILYTMRMPFKDIMEDNLFCRKMVTLGIMIVLTPMIVWYSRVRKITMSVLPKEFSGKYIVFTIAVTIFMALSISFFFGKYELPTLIYGCFVTPIFEETLFRGFIWNRTAKTINNKWIVYGINVFLFAIWHIGYCIPQLQDGKIEIALMKATVGFVYGIILGLIRIRSGNCYSTMLIHGVMNLFG